MYQQPETQIPQLNDREAVQYLLGDAPSWMMRYGISAIACIFVLFLCLSYWIRYPDVITAPVVLTTASPPIRVVAQTGGRIAQLLVSEKQAVSAGQVLAIIENTAKEEDVMRVEIWLNQSVSAGSPPPQGLQLGPLQDVYSVFSQHWADYRYFALHSGTEARIQALRQQIEQMQQIVRNLERQQTILKEEFNLNTKEYNRQTRLHKEKVIADSDLEKSEAVWLQQKRQIETAEAAMLQNTLQIKQLESQITELKQGHSDQNNEKQLTLAEDTKRLWAAIAAWKQTYLVTAPITGFVSFSKVLSNRQTVTNGAEILAIVPASEQEDKTGRAIIGRATLPAENTGKIMPGMRTIVRLDGFPAQQFGTLEGSVAQIAQLPQEAGYLANIALPDTLKTSYGKAIPFRQEMSGQARIIAEDRRVIDRIFDRIGDLLKNR